MYKKIKYSVYVYFFFLLQDDFCIIKRWWVFYLYSAFSYLRRMLFFFTFVIYLIFIFTYIRSTFFFILTKTWLSAPFWHIPHSILLQFLQKNAFLTLLPFFPKNYWNVFHIRNAHIVVGSISSHYSHFRYIYYVWGIILLVLLYRIL